MQLLQMKGFPTSLERPRQQVVEDAEQVDAILSEALPPLRANLVNFARLEHGAEFADHDNHM